jgi:glyoxylase-like metal-dependent hydrolase (beta-lactamase superfamily II)
MTEPPLRWQIGEAVVTRIVESTFEGGLDTFLPQATPEAVLGIDWLRPHFITDDGILKFSIHALVIEVDGLRVLVDTCVGNEKPRAAFAMWDMQQYRFLEDLEAAGFPRESIDIVLCTHLHLDHVGWNTMKMGDRWVPTFPNARYLIERREMAALRSLEGALPSEDGLETISKAMLSDSILPVVEAGLVDLVDADHRVSPSIRLVPTPGHTIGHVSVQITSGEASAIITGDSIHHPCQLAHPDWSIINDFDPGQSARTREEMFSALAGTQTLMIGTHWPAPSAGHVHRAGPGYRLAERLQDRLSRTSRSCEGSLQTPTGRSLPTS